MMNRICNILLFLAFSLTGCVTQFIPDTGEEDKALVIEGRITDRNETYEVQVSALQPVYPESTVPDVPLYNVSVFDHEGREYIFSHAGNGKYLSDSTEFLAMAGIKYKLRVEGNGQLYESDYVEMKPVPCIDSVYAGPEYNEFYRPGETTWGYQVYLDSYDPSGECRYFMWTFTETWEFRYPWRSPWILNRICWKSAVSTDINILSTSSLEESRVVRQPIAFITNETDRLIVRYSILVRQHSVSDEEFVYRENLRRTVFEAGGLYDAIPGSIQGNIKRIDDPSEQVLGFFGVSAVSEKRIFIENVQHQFPSFYAYCPIDTVPVADYDPGSLGPNVYILTEFWEPPASPRYILTIRRECIDCSLVGTSNEPDYWNDPVQAKNTYLLSHEEH